jgi:hypothetical protein
MSGSSYNPPVQPGYGDSMAEALDAQVALLTGEKVGDSDFSQYNEIGGLKGITEKYEAPLRKATAQIDTDVMRQTLLGRGTGETYTEDGKIITGYEGTGAQDGQYTVDQSATAKYDGYSNTTGHNGTSTVTTKLIDTSTGKVVKESQSEVWIPWKDEYGEKSKGVEHPVKGGLKGLGLPEENLRNAQTELQNAYGNDFKGQLSEAQMHAVTYTDRMGSLLLGQEGDVQERKPIYKEDPNSEDGLFRAPAGSFQKGASVRTGDGMVDLVGDSRAVQEQTRSEDYAQYVKDNTDLQADFNAKRQAGDQRTIEEYGRDHYEADGKAEGRDLPMGEYSLQDTADQAGFRKGEFMGLSALSEDIARGGQQRAREADIADVERLGGRATDAYRAQGDLSGALAQARGVGSGGDQELSAIPKDPLFEGAALNSLAARTKAENLLIDKIESGGMTYAKADPAADLTADTGYKASSAAAIDPLSAATGYTPTAGISGGVYGGELGTYDPTANSTLGGPAQYPQPTLRSNLLADAKTSLTGGLTAREERQISEAFKAQSTMMGRTFDQSAGLAEAQARTLEDRNRQAINRQYAQQVLGQEAGLQESDLGRGLQASLANQQAANQAAQYGVGAGLQREQASAQFAQQTALANQQAANRAAEYGVGAGLQQEQLGAQFDQQTALANQAALQDARRYTAQEGMQAKQMELGRQTAGVERQLTAEEKDIERIMRQQAMEEQYRQQGLGAERANAAQMVGLEQATSADPFQAILQRQGQNNLAAGGAVFGQAGYGLDSGPQYLNPESGLGFIQNQSTNAANMYNAQVGAGATKSAGLMGGIGSLAGGLLGNSNLFKCWVAREVYGEHNPAWLLFRNWLDTDAPRWFDKLYLTFGERFANFISNKPRLKARIRLWMDTKIGR